MSYREPPPTTGRRAKQAQQHAATQDVLAAAFSSEPGTVSSVTAAGASDGHALVKVRWRGADIPMPYVPGYTPTVGDPVVVACPEKSPPFILSGPLIGTP